MVTSYWEMVSSFINSGVLHQELFFESGRELLFVWERVRDILPAVREMQKDPRAMKNLERVAEAYIGWLNAQRAGLLRGVFEARARISPVIGMDRRSLIRR